MALQAFKGGVFFPPMIYGASGGIATSSAYLLDASGEKAALVARASVSKSIRKVHFRTGTVTTGATVDVRIESVDSSGDPSGTLLATNTNIAHVIADANDNVWLTSAALTADAAVTPGALFAVVISVPAGANLNIVGLTDESHSSAFPYGDLFTASWVKQAVAPMFIIEYSDGTTEPVFGIVGGGSPITTNTFGNGSNPDERGLKFRVPFPCTVAGAWAWIDTDGDFTINLYDSNGTSVIASAAVTNAAALRQADNPGLHFFTFSATVNLSANTYYRLTIRPDSATTVVSYAFDVPSAALMDQFPGGQDVHHTHQTDASGSWTDTTTQRDYLGLVITAFSDGAGAGGGASQLINSGALIG